MVDKLRVRKEASLEFHWKLVKAAFEVFEKGTEFPFKSCINCLAFHEKSGFCSRWKANPPPRTIVFGCAEHDDIQDIPF